MTIPIPAPRHHVPTVLAIGACVFIVAKLLHEGLGHGGACLAVGADLRGWSMSWADCEGDTGAARRAVAAAGTFANLAAGLLAAVALGRVGSTVAHRYALWLFAAVNLSMGAGYVAVDPLFGFGDWTAFLDGFEPKWPLRLCLAALGAAAYAGVVRWARGALARFVLGDGRLGGARTLALVPYLAIGGGLMTILALRNALGPVFAFTSALATLGGCSMLAWCWTWPVPGQGEAVPATVERSNLWLILGTALCSGGLLWWGPGVGSAY